MADLDTVEKNKTMKKLLLFIFISLFSFSAIAQNGKKTRNTARNTAESISERKMSSRFNGGLRSFHTAQYEEAERIFSSIIIDNPKHAPSYYMRAKIFTAQKQYSEAEEALKQAVKIDKNNIWYQVALADNYLSTENYKKALPLWENICKKITNNELYLFNLYECYQKSGDYSKMTETLNKIEHLLGSNEEITQKKVSIWLRQNKLDAAVQEYELLINNNPYNSKNYLKAGLLNEEFGQYERALKFYEKAYQLFPEDPEVNMMLANFWILRKNEAKSETYIEKILPDPNIDLQKKLPFIRKQIEQMNAQNSSKIETWTKQLATAHPDNIEIEELLAVVNFKNEKYAEATDNFAKFLKFDDSDIDNWNMFLQSAEKSGKSATILQFEEEITTIFPQSPSVLISIANAFAKNNNIDKAIEYYKQALAFSYEQSQQSLLKQYLFEAYTKKGDTDNANRYKSRQ